ncbi:MAG: DUF190 domain-containing protein [Rhodanobacteraceae bacterium]
MNAHAPTAGVYLRFFVHKDRRHRDGELLHEWLLSEAKDLGLPGGTAFRAVAGFGRLRVTQETMRVDFVVTREAADQILERVRAEEDIQMFYAMSPAEFGTL